MRKQIALAVALALSSTLAVAAGAGGSAGSSSGGASTGASGSAGTGASTGGTGGGQSGVTGSGQTGVTGGPTGGGSVGAEGSTGATLTPQAFWDKHSKDGNLGREDAMKFRSSDGRPIEFERLDMNKDGRVSQAEWISYHSSTGAAGRTGTTSPGEPTGGTLTSPRGSDPAGGSGSPSRTQPMTPATPASPSTR
jgi:hypothetical protein